MEDIENIKASKLNQRHSLWLFISKILTGAKVNETEQPLSDTQSAAAHCLKLLRKRLH